MRVHLLAQPNSQTTEAYVLDGFQQLVIRFAKVLKALHLHTILYASEENEAPCDELVTVITKQEQELAAGVQGATYYTVNHRQEPSPWTLGNARMIDAIAQRKQPGDIICTIGGRSQKAVTDAHPDLPAVEFSIGYPGTYSDYRIFQSFAWRHATHGFQGENVVHPMDTVIPGFIDPPVTEWVAQRPDNYLLYVGRIVPKKGIAIACETAKTLGMPLKLVGWGNPSLITYGEFINGATVSKRERDFLMSRAQAIFCPTQYLEPFNMVAIEAQSYGTPVISTDMGGFTETVEQWETGVRCNTPDEFVTAARLANAFDRDYIARRAHNLYSIKAVVPQYNRYFERLARHLQEKG